jgi:hypothetical protein
VVQLSSRRGSHWTPAPCQLFWLGQVGKFLAFLTKGKAPGGGGILVPVARKGAQERLTQAPGLIRVPRDDGWKEKGVVRSYLRQEGVRMLAKLIEKTDVDPR